MTTVARHGTRQGGVLVFCIVVIFALMAPAVVFGQSGADGRELREPGILPGGVLFTAERLVENIGTLLTFDEDKKARRLVNLAEERLAEAEVLAGRGSDSTSYAVSLYERYLTNALRSADELEDNSNVQEAVASATSRHRSVLERVTGNVPEESRAVAERSLEQVNEGYERSLNRLAERDTNRFVHVAAQALQDRARDAREQTQGADSERVIASLDQLEELLGRIEVAREDNPARAARLASRLPGVLNELDSLTDVAANDELAREVRSRARRLKERMIERHLDALRDVASFSPERAAELFDEAAQSRLESVRRRYENTDADAGPEVDRAEATREAIREYERYADVGRDISESSRTSARGRDADAVVERATRRHIDELLRARDEAPQEAQTDINRALDDTAQHFQEVRERREESQQQSQAEAGASTAPADDEGGESDSGGIGNLGEQIMDLLPIPKPEPQPTDATPSLEPVAITSCNAVSYYQVPDNPRFFMGRHFQATGGACGTRFGVSLFELVESGGQKAMRHVRDILPTTHTLANGEQVTHAYDPIVIKTSAGKLHLAYECAVSGTVSTCMVPLTSSLAPHMQYAKVLVRGVAGGSSDLTASVPKWIQAGGKHYIGWTQVRLRNPDRYFANLTSRVAEITASADSPTLLVGAGKHKEISVTSSEAKTVFGSNGNPELAQTADLFDAVPLSSGGILGLAAIGRQGCGIPLDTVTDCYAFRAYEASSLLNNGIANGREVSALQFFDNPIEYSRAVTVDGKKQILIRLIPPVVKKDGGNYPPSGLYLMDVSNSLGGKRILSKDPVPVTGQASTPAVEEETQSSQDETPTESADEPAAEEEPVLLPEIRLLYLQVFDREPDAVGWSQWSHELDSGAMTLGQIRNEFVNSEETRINLDQFYLELLERHIGTEGLRNFRQYLNGGGRLSDIPDLIRQSDEYKAFQEPDSTTTSDSTDTTETAETEPEPTTTPKEDWIISLYQLVLNRAPSDASLDSWSSQSDRAILRGIYLSSEASFSDDEDTVRKMYQGILQRSPESQAAIDNWVNSINTVGLVDTVDAMLDSDEAASQTYY